MSRLQRVRDNLRRAYDSGRESVRVARTDDAVLEPDRDDEFEPPVPEPPAAVHESTNSRDDSEVPHSLRIAAAWGWRLIVVGLVGWALLNFVSMVSIVVIPLAISLLLSALLSPAVRWLLRLRVPSSLATFLVLICGIGAVAGTLTLVISQFVDGVPELTQNATAGVRQIQQWLKTGPLHLSDAQVDQAIDNAQEWISSNTASLTSTGIATAATLFEVVTGMLLVIFSTYFFLRDGRKIWRFIVRLFPVNARWSLADAGDASWATLGSYVRATVLVAFIDAIGIGIALVVLKIQFPLPLAALVFLGAFIPIVGASVSGAVAVLVALVDEGWVVALVLLGAVILVQQLEGHVLQPLIMGRAVAIHPLVVIIGIACGVTLAGIIGALVAVPLIAVLNTAIRRLSRRRPEAPANAVVVGGGEPPGGGEPRGGEPRGGEPRGGEPRGGGPAGGGDPAGRGEPAG